MEQSCNFLLYTIIRESQGTAYIKLRLKLHHQSGIKEGDSPLLTLSIRLSYKQAKYLTHSGILGWAMDVGMEQSCNFPLYMIVMERQETAYIELRVK